MIKGLLLAFIGLNDQKVKFGSQIKYTSPIKYTSQIIKYTSQIIKYTSQQLSYFDSLKNNCVQLSIHLNSCLTLMAKK